MRGVAHRIDTVEHQLPNLKVCVGDRGLALVLAVRRIEFGSDFAVDIDIDFEFEVRVEVVLERTVHVEVDVVLDFAVRIEIDAIRCRFGIGSADRAKPRDVGSPTLHTNSTTMTTFVLE